MAELIPTAREVFKIIDFDKSGLLEKSEILRSVKEDTEVIKFFTDLLRAPFTYFCCPQRLEHYLGYLFGSRLLDIDGWVRVITFMRNKEDTLNKDACMLWPIELMTVLETEDNETFPSMGVRRMRNTIYKMVDRFSKSKA